MKSGFFVFGLILSAVFLMSFTLAWEGPYNYWNGGNWAIGNQSNQSTAPYDLILNPNLYSSLEASGSQALGCATSTFGGLTTRVAPFDENGGLQAKKDILESYAKLVNIKKNTAETFDANLKVLVDLLKKDKKNKYVITIKRINKSTDTPIHVLPVPKIETDGNVKIKVYRPYNFNVSDIVGAMRVGKAVGLGGVLYKEYKNGSLILDSKGNAIAIFGHMFQAMAISTKPMKANPRNHDFMVYEPYRPEKVATGLSHGKDGRLYMRMWNKWFYMEELIYIEKIPIIINPPINKSPIKEIVFNRLKNPFTAIFLSPPGFCGDKIVVAPEECDDGNSLGNDQCTNACKFTTCGDGIIQKPNGHKQQEQCDDGNSKSGDGCSASCKLEYCGDGIVQKGLGESCEKPGSVCDYADTEGGATYALFCSNSCTCPKTVQIVDIFG